MSNSKNYERKTFTDSNGIKHDIRAKSKRELQIKLAQAMQDAEEGISVNNNITVNAWANVCFEQYKTCDEYTLKNEVWRFDKHVGSEIGRRKLADIKPLDIQRILNTADKAGLAHYTIKQVYQLMRFVFAKAEENGIIRRSPVRAITIPKGKAEQKRRALTAEEDMYFLEACEKKLQYAFFLAMRLCGLRNSEVANLRGIDIVQIQGATFIHVQSGKTANAARNVPCPSYLLDRLPKSSNPFDFVFTNRNGGQVLKQNQREIWKSLTHEMQRLAGCRTYKGALVPPYPLMLEDITPYSLRHSYCTDLARDGVDMRTAQKLMGHADLSMISKVYTHIDDGMLVAEAKRINLKYQNAEEACGKVVDISGKVAQKVAQNA